MITRVAPTLGYVLLLRWSISVNQRSSAVEVYAFLAFFAVEIVSHGSRLSRFRFGQSELRNSVGVTPTTRRKTCAKWLGLV